MDEMAAAAIADYYRDPISFLQKLPDRASGVSPVAGTHADPVFVYAPDVVDEVLNGRDRFVRAGAVTVGEEDTATRRVSGGLLAMNGEEHSTHRRALLSHFRDQGQAELFCDATLREVRRATRKWQVDSKVDVTRAARTVSFNTVCSTTLGIDDESTVEELAQLVEAWISYMLEPENRFADKMGRVPERSAQLAERLEEKLLDAIAQQPAELLPGPARWLVTSARAGSIDRAAMVGQFVTLLTAGWETTSSALTWTILLLAHHPQLARKITTEISALGEPLSFRAVDSARLLEHTLRESLRLLSPALGVKRVAIGTQQLKDVAVPASGEIICTQYLRHRDPTVYPEPLAFNPERWESTKVRPVDYFPFGLGWRRCIGERLAIIQLKSAIADLVGRFAFAVPAGTVVNRRVRMSMAPAGEVQLDLLAAGAWEIRSPASGDWCQMFSLR